jgi:C-terminal processing protease CtpA/Prc
VLDFRMLRLLLLLIASMTTTWATAQCSMCLCQSRLSGCPDCWGGSCDFSACQYHCGSPGLADSTAAFKGPGFTVDQFHGRNLVTSVLKGSPAEIAGVRPGDKLLAIDSMSLPLNCKMAFRDDSPHRYSLLRGSEPYHVTLASVGMGELVARVLHEPVFLATADSGPSANVRMYPFITGLEAEPVANTWVVNRIIPFSPAAKAGLQKGDRIIRMTDSSTGEAFNDPNGSGYMARVQVSVLHQGHKSAVSLRLQSAATMLRTLQLSSQTSELLLAAK